LPQKSTTSLLQDGRKISGYSFNWSREKSTGEGIVDNFEQGSLNVKFGSEVNGQCMEDVKDIKLMKRPTDCITIADAHNSQSKELSNNLETSRNVQATDPSKSSPIKLTLHNNSLLNMPYLKFMGSSGNTQQSHYLDSTMNSNSSQPIDFSRSERPEPVSSESDSVNSLLRAALTRTGTGSVFLHNLLRDQKNIQSPFNIAPDRFSPHSSIIQSSTIDIAVPMDELDTQQMTGDKLPPGKNCCPYCAKTFHYRSSYRRHVKIHQGIFR